MSLKTLNKWLVFIAVLFGVFFGIWVSLEFILTLEEMREYSLIFKFWSGVQRGSVFACALLAVIWFFTFFYSFIVAIRDNEPTKREKPTRTRNTSKRRKQRPHRQRQQSHVVDYTPGDFDNIEDEED